MFRTRPPGFALLCVGMWVLQLVLMALTFHRIDTVRSTAHLCWEFAAVGASLVLGALLLVQLPRALQWRQRLNPRMSAEVLSERRRIARDLHDNLGSQLVFALVQLDPDSPREREIHAALEKCMLDMRLFVDAIDGSSAPIADRLAQLRYRIEPVFTRRGIRMVWDVEPPLSAVLPNADSATHLVAIVQEALSNALQYAEATEIQISASFTEGAQSWWIEVSDNGKGMPAPGCFERLAAAGRGMVGMGQRARLAGGELSVRRGKAGGTCIRAVVPCITVV